MNLLALLAEKNVIDAAQRERVEALAVESGISYERALLDGGVDPDSIRDAIGAYFDLPTRAISERDTIKSSALKYLSEESARHYKILPIELEDGILIVGLTDPDDLSFRDALNFITAKDQIPYKLVVILERDFEYGVKSYENITGEVDEALGVLESELEEESEGVPEEKKKIEVIKEDAPVTKIVATILRYAVDGSASDIHIEPSAKKTNVRFRVDGTLVHSLELPEKIHQAVVARIKILSSLRLDEKRKPQDGRFSASIDGRQIDFRVSILPTNHGEKVVMRILDTEAGIRTLEDTGVSAHNIALIRKALAQPFGIILISGPTGSGKSTTLYGMLSEVDRIGKNVISLEDPVEYSIDGVSQSQVRPEIGYTFANGLRTALRQDPDVIMVGEIRDKETAQLAIQAALTGHLVLSTIHTNNSVGVIPRLIDMGVDPYLIAPTLELALAQRLVRRICPNSGKKVPVAGSIKALIDSEFEDLPERFRKIIPQSDHVLFVEATEECSSGTKGRVAVMEAITIDEEIERLILDDADEEKILAVARKNGFISMKEDAIIKALDHIIPFEEISTLGGAMLVSDEAEKEAVEIKDVDLAPSVDNQVSSNV
ncbi:MAG: GspE/PulE family protein [Candidatus Pacebacteria bacterium]|nr:GspE/PulE family protein [Candidatus Paceibacterota bacterium]MCF7857488.1 GspE/PulE family protein [Candidatus Paceibacterota bacterium]